MRLLLLTPLNSFLLRLDGLVLAQHLYVLISQHQLSSLLNQRMQIVEWMCHLIQRGVQDDGQRRRTPPFDLINDAAVFF